MKTPQKIGLFSLAGIVAALTGCRATYVPPTEMDRSWNSTHVELNEQNYATGNTKEFVDSAVKGLEGKVIAGTEPEFNFNEYAQIIGDDGLKTVFHLKQASSLAQKGIAGMDASLVEIYTQLNGMSDDVRKAISAKDGVKNFYGALTDAQRIKISESKTALDMYLAYLVGQSKVSFTSESIEALKTKAAESNNAALINATNGLVNNFKSYAEQTKVRRGALDAMFISESNYAGIENSIILQNMLEKYNTGVSYLEMGPKMIKKLGLEQKFKENIDEIKDGFRTNDGIDQDDRVRKYRMNIARPIWEAYINGKISSKAFESGIATVDYTIAVAARETKPQEAGTTLAKNVGMLITPGLPFILALNDTSYLIPSDTSAEALKEGGVKPENMYAAVIEYARLIERGATNGKHVVGEKPWGLFGKHLGMTAAQALAIYGISSAASSGSGSGPSFGGGEYGGPGGN